MTIATPQRAIECSYALGGAHHERIHVLHGPAKRTRPSPAEHDELHAAQLSERYLGAFENHDLIVPE
jgi:hypothetical protein